MLHTCKSKCFFASSNKKGIFEAEMLFTGGWAPHILHIPYGKDVPILYVSIHTISNINKWQNFQFYTTIAAVEINALFSFCIHSISFSTFQCYFYNEGPVHNQGCVFHSLEIIQSIRGCAKAHFQASSLLLK